MKQPWNYAVCIKTVPAFDELTPQDYKDGNIDRTKLRMKLNPDDLCALQTALDCKQRFGGSISVLTMGPQSCEKQLREALALGADRAYLLSDPAFAGADVLATAQTLAAALRQIGGFDLILCGRRTLDGGTGETPGETAQLLGYGYVSGVTVLLQAEEQTLTLERQLGDLRQTLQCTLPLVVCVEPQDVQIAMPTLLSQLQSRQKPLTILTKDDFASAALADMGHKGSATAVKTVYTPTAAPHETTHLHHAQDAADRIWNEVMPQ